MRRLVGCLTLAGLALAGVSRSQAQVLPPMRGDSVVISEFEEPGPYAAVPPRIYAAPPRYDDEIAPMLPPRAVYRMLRQAGFSPIGMLQQRGPVYTMAAIDRYGEDGRIVIDARSGRILRFMPGYRIGYRTNEDVVARSAPPAAVPELPQYRRPAFDGAAANTAPAPAPKEKLASRTPSVPLPKPPPVRAVATPAKPVAVEKPPVVDKPIAEKPAEPAAVPAPAPVQQSAVTAPKPAETPIADPVKTAPAATPAETPPTVAAPVVEAKPELPAAAPDKPAPVQGLE